MRRNRITILTFILLCMLTVFSTRVDADEALINTNNLNVRNAPNIQSEVIDQVQAGEFYKIIQTENDWVQIKLPDKVGWISSEYLTLQEKSEEKQPPTIEKEKSIMTNYDNIHLRSGPSTEHPIISNIQKDTILTIIPENNNWYKVTSEKVDGYILKSIINSKQIESSFNNKIIMIDAGHGGLDVGSISISGAYEKELTLLTALELEQKLTLLGAKVILTRTNDDYIRLASRATLANITNTDVFISIHYNSFPELPTVSGIGTYYYHSKDELLAQTIQQELIKETDANDREITFGNYQVLRQSNKPAILVELGFISNERNEQLLLTNTYQEKLVKGIINGLNMYFSN